ncbi:vicilin Car i 2.0101-like [Eucalyptus grandis]|uniref:vicilin Car i 2.0101-like n=1 Tax=Eucalyptus grandis TaxID=71139 RepID=UPI00192F0B7B|nr:vicilin Car i 2.0101-like [Eucalyptus grandis]
MVFKVPRLLSLLILFLSLCLTSLALRRGPETEVLRCLDDCDGEDVQEYITCHKECELRYRGREERREEEERPGSREIDPRWQRRRCRHRGGGGGGGEREPEGPRGEREPAWGPGGEYDQCRRLCEPYKPRERERCWEQCEERERARERRRDREREREVNDGVRNPSRSERYERCERACERQAGGQQRQLCKFRCRQQREREERETPGGGDAKLFYYDRRSAATVPTLPAKMRATAGQRTAAQAVPTRMRTAIPGAAKSRFRAEGGQIRVLEQFDKRSRLLRGLKNYRPEIFEANPSTFVLPHRVDADCILIVLKG